MALDSKDLEQIERVIYKNADDMAVSISRSFERMEERIDTFESRLYSRIAELEETIHATRLELGDSIAQVRGDTRELLAEEQ